MSMALFAKTPAVVAFDSRGLVVREVAYHRQHLSPDVTDTRITRHGYDTRGSLARSADPRLFDAGSSNVEMIHSLSGKVIRNTSVDAGVDVALFDAIGRLSWVATNLEADIGDSRQTITREWEYERGSLPGRLLKIVEQRAGEPRRISERFVWGRPVADVKALNLAGLCVSHYDTAGLNRIDAASVNGVPQSTTRRLANANEVVDWKGESEAEWDTLLDGEAFTTLTTVDALGAVCRSIDAGGNSQRQAFDLAGSVKSRWLTLRGDQERAIVRSITYSAAGQVVKEEHGNGIITSYAYDPAALRLEYIRTERPPGHPAGAKVLRDLRYEYDPVGNLERVEDGAESIRFWRNQQIEPVKSYIYDSLYQLVQASGREMANAEGPKGKLPGLRFFDDATYTLYTRAYDYDRGGNLTQIRHSAPATNNNYITAITVSARSNRAVSSALTEDPSEVDAMFSPGGHQSMLGAGQALLWNLRGELSGAVIVARDDAERDDETYRYGADGGRIDKRRRLIRSGVASTQRCLYLPGLELRRTEVAGTDAEDLAVVLLGEAGRGQVRVLHWTLGKPDEIANDQLRFSYDDPLGSSNLEADGNGEIVSEEDYYPYGGTAAWIGRSEVEVNYKTVRYSGKERDATGLYYYGYRYYQPWAGRWLSADPGGTSDGLNLYRMARNNPSTFRDAQGLNPVRSHFDEKDIEGFSSVFGSMQEGLRASGIDPRETVFISVGRSPQVLVEYIRQSGFETGLLQISGLSIKSTIPDPAGLSADEKRNRAEYLESSLGKVLSERKHALLIDYSLTGSSVTKTQKLLQPAFPRVDFKMAIISRFLNDADLSPAEKAVFHHKDNVLFDSSNGEDGSARLNYNNRGVLRVLKILHHEIDKGLTYTEKFPYTLIDSGELPKIDEGKRRVLTEMMTAAMETHRDIQYIDAKNRSKKRYIGSKAYGGKFNSSAEYISSWNFKRSRVGSVLYGLRRAITGYRS